MRELGKNIVNAKGEPKTLSVALSNTNLILTLTLHKPNAKLLLT